MKTLLVLWALMNGVIHLNFNTVVYITAAVIVGLFVAWSIVRMSK